MKNNEQEISRAKVMNGEATLIEYPRRTEIMIFSASKISTFKFNKRSEAEQWADFYQTSGLMPQVFPANIVRPFDIRTIDL